MYNRFFFRKLGCLSDPLSCSRPSGYSCIILINVQTLHVASCILRKFCVLFCCIIFLKTLQLVSMVPYVMKKYVYQVALIVQSSKENCCVFLLNLPPNVFRNKRQYQFSRIIDYDLTANIVNQHRQHKSNANAKTIRNKKRDHTFMTGWKGLKIYQVFGTKHIRKIRNKKSMLTTLLFPDGGYDLTKQLFWDLNWIRYGWALTRLPVNCECGVRFNQQVLNTPQPNPKYHCQTTKRMV